MTESDKGYFVYIHTFPNGKHYVGITQQNPSRRWHGGRGYDKQPYISNAIKKYGWENVYHIVLYENMTKEEAEKKERELISVLKSNERDFGYNIANGGFCRGSMSEESRKKLSESRKGIVFSEEHLKNLSISHKNLKPTKEQNYKNMMNNPRRKPVICIETNTVYPSVREAGRKTGIGYKLISAVCNGKYGHNTAGGYRWKYV